MEEGESKLLFLVPPQQGLGFGSWSAVGTGHGITGCLQRVSPPHSCEWFPTLRGKNFSAIILLIFFYEAISDFNKYIFLGVPCSSFNIDFFHTTHFSLLPNHRQEPVMGDTPFHLTKQTKSKRTPTFPYALRCSNMWRPECSIQAAQNAAGCYALPGLSSQYLPRHDRNTITWWTEEEYVTTTRGRTMELESSQAAPSFLSEESTSGWWGHLMPSAISQDGHLAAAAVTQSFCQLFSKQCNSGCYSGS